ncbi:MAG: response regulator [Dysgonamonadaceae bacterium]|jgi:signal transduction histidine kinase/CheY-like chemotaxis protein/ligand-binding sensor domain-containing protein/AraC-like DNA-binding protein|nr:response regulator [Dysgonamonadaceae bacterium]
MKNRFLIGFFLCLFQSAFPVYFKHIGIGNGLSQTSVMSIHQDMLGRMWFGTQEGITIYDGNNTLVYKPWADEENKSPEETLYGNECDFICSNTEGSVFFRADGALMRYDIRKQKFHTVCANGVKTVSTYKGNVWCAVWDSLFVYDTAADSLQFRAKTNIQSISRILVSEDKIWLGSNNGLYLMEEGSSPQVIIPDKDIFSIFESSTKDIWIGSRMNGLYKIAPDGTTTVYTENNPPGTRIASDQIRELVEDNSGNIWFGTFKGLQKFNPHTQDFTLYARDNLSGGLTHSSVFSLCFDRQGTIWAGTYYGGVNYFNPERDIFSHYVDNPDRNDCLNYPFVGNMVEDKDGDLWICTEGGGLNWMNRKKRIFLYFRPEDKSGTEYNNLKSISYDEKRKTIYIGTHTGGLFKFMMPTHRFYRYLENVENSSTPHPNEIIYHTEIYNDNLYISARNGLFRMDQKTEKFESLSHYCVNFFIDSNGFLWYSFARNLTRLNLNNLSDVKIISLAEQNIRFEVTKIIEHQGNIYLGTQGSGLYRYDDAENRFTAFTVSSGHLMSNYCYNIAQTNLGELLITGDKGVTFFDPDKETSRFIKLEVPLPITTITNGCGVLICNNNEIFVGGTDGLTSFWETDLGLDKKEYSLYFSDIWIHNERVAPDDRHKVLTKALAFTDNVNLTYEQNNIVIHFASNNYVDFQKHNEYEYMLEGFDIGWTPTNLNSIYYTNLNPGSYRLIVQEKDVSNGQKIVLYIHISQPWYNTIWAWIGYILVTILIFSLIIRTQNSRRALALSLEKEKQDKERNEELTQAKLRFFISISHEFRTPLTLIISQIELLFQNTSLSPTVFNKILKINKNANRMRGLIGELLEFQKLEQSFVALRVSEQDLNHFLKDIFLSFRELAVQRQIRYQMASSTNELPIWFNANQLQKVFFNLISNAFKHTRDGGCIDFIIKDEEETVVVQVIDNGIGMSAEDSKHVFDLFYQADNGSRTSASNPGTGIGLTLSQNIVQLHHGEIGVQSELGYGSIFTIKLLKGKTHFEEDGKTVILEHPEDFPEKDGGIPEMLTEKDYEEIGQNFSGTTTGKKYSVLLVEDNKELLQTLQTLFSPLYNVLTAHNGKEGLEIAMTENPDLIVSDVMMPQMTGTEMCMRIKNNADLCHIPVVLLTALNSEEQNIEGLQQGADDYIGKPFHSKILLMRCNNIIRNRLSMQRKLNEQPDSDLSLLAVNALDRKLLERINQSIDGHLGDPDFDVHALAREVGLSRSSLFTKFKALIGVTPNDFIQNHRLKRAATLLCEYPDMQIVEIADQLGFSSSIYFSRCFKTEYGIPPTQYRKTKEKNSISIHS